MHSTLLALTEILIVLFAIAGFTAIIGASVNKEAVWRNAAWALSLLGPAILGLYWNAQLGFRAEDAVFWSRLMGGDAGRLLSIASLGILAGSGLALGAMALSNRLWQLAVGALCVSCAWYVIYLHPTPHYVPMPEWIDNIIWGVILIGGSLASLLVYSIIKPQLLPLQKPAAVAAGFFAMMSLVLVLAHGQANSTMALAALSAEQRVKQTGCMACHTMGGLGQEEPGGALESVASRSEDVVLAFMKEPTADMAKQLGIRENPTGEMGGVHLSNQEAVLLTEALAELFEVKPPSTFGPGFEEVETIIVGKNCLACHSFKGEGAPGGGLGGALEDSAHLELDILIAWMIEPTEENALKLSIRDVPMGAMVDFALPENEAKIIAEWLKTLQPQE